MSCLSEEKLKASFISIFCIVYLVLVELLGSCPSASSLLGLQWGANISEEETVFTSDILSWILVKIHFKVFSTFFLFCEQIARESFSFALMEK